MKKGVKYMQSLTARDIYKMSDKEIKNLVKTGKCILMKRYQKQKGTTGVAPIWRGNNPYKLKTTRTTREQDMRTLIREIELLGNKTTQVGGYQKFLNRQMRFLDVGELTESQIKKIWESYDKINEIHGSLKYKIDYRQIVRTVAEQVKANIRVSFSRIDKVLKEVTQNELDINYSQEEWNEL